MTPDAVKPINNIKDKVFLVTGGAAGVGAKIVRALLTENARHVAFLDVSEREGETLEGEMTNKFGALRAKFIKCDISNDDQLATAYKQVVDKYRRLDCVINNAAVLSADEQDFKRIVDINFTATVSSTQKALDIMGENKGGSGGTVINVSSLLALRHRNRLPVYAATKTAVLQFSSSIGGEEFYSKTKVRVITVCFGPTDTAILHRHNLANFSQDCSQCLTFRATERQRVESAASGVLEVINTGESGSTWMVAEDKPALDITRNIQDGFAVLSKDVGGSLLDL